MFHYRGLFRGKSDDLYHYVTDHLLNNGLPLPKYDIDKVYNIQRLSDNRYWAKLNLFPFQ